MGVQGLWKLIEASSEVVPIERLENKVLAVDISIWLHEAIKGFKDSKGASVPNAHLLGIWHRVCKLLYFRIRPIFVFDGAVPALKKNTIAKRNSQKSKNLRETYNLQKQLLNVLSKHSAVNKVISEKAMANMEEYIQESPEKLPKESNVNDIYKLPLIQLEPSESLSVEEEEEENEEIRHVKHWDLYTIDEKSSQFKSLPVDVRHEILTELKETRKQSSWGRIHELPTQSDNFSIYQMRRLLKRYSVQVSLEETEKEMGGHALSLGELQALLSDHGVITSNDKIGGRIASSENTRYLLIKDVKKALEEAASRKETETESVKIREDEPISEALKINEEEVSSDDLRKAIQLSLQDLPSTSNLQDLPSTSNLDDLPSTSKVNENFEEAKSLKNSKNSLSTKILHSLKTVEGKAMINIETDVSELTNESHENSLSLLQSAKHIGSISSILNQTIQGNSNIQINTNTSTCDVEAQKSKQDSEILPSKASHEETIELMSDSDLDSADNFIEIEEGNSLVNNTSKNVLEIIIEPKGDLEDDMFADIFSSKSIENIADSKTVHKENHLKESRAEEMDFEIIATTEKEESNKNVPSSVAMVPLTMEQLKEIEADLVKEKHDLIIEKSTKERLANSITNQMYQDAQELLQLFGVPYIVAPMEAEAQCAFLDQINLTDGTITDDSDIWLFGGTTVYKNFFNQTKHVMEFQSEKIQHFFKLSRYEMILLALLVGSDYTTGIQGVGPVTALEILAAFPIKKTTSEVLNNYHIISGLQEFQKWFKQGKIIGPGRTILKNKLKNIVLGDNFPSMQVVQAYMEPKVETNRENFSWSKPDVTALVEFAREKFGWSKTKSEEILKPVLKRMKETAKQTKITSYFKMKQKLDSGKVENKMSKRVKLAVNKMGKEQEDLSSDEDGKTLKQTMKQSRKKVKQIESTIQTEMEKEAKKNELVKKKTRAFTHLHKKEKIPQREQDKANLLRSKMKAIETFRKSKQGPGYVKTRPKVRKELKEDANLSESSSEEFAC